MLTEEGGVIDDLIVYFVNPGFYRMVWKGKDGRGDEASSGIYFVHLEAGTHRAVRKIMLIR